MTGTAYTDTPLAADAEDGSYEFSYAVAPVYNHGAARVSDEVKVSVSHSGIDIVDVDDLDNAKVYNLQGIRIATRDIVPGIYIVVDARGSRKALVK